MSKEEGDCDRQHVWNWLKNMFLLYQTMGADRKRFIMFLIGEVVMLNRAGCFNAKVNNESDEKCKSWTGFESTNPPVRP
jgi:hypothetical protein